MILPPTAQHALSRWKYAARCGGFPWPASSADSFVVFCERAGPLALYILLPAIPLLLILAAAAVARCRHPLSGKRSAVRSGAGAWHRTSSVRLLPQAGGEAGPPLDLRDTQRRRRGAVTARPGDPIASR